MSLEPKTSRFVGVANSGMGGGSGGIYGRRRRRRRRTSGNEVDNLNPEDEGGMNDDRNTNYSSDDAERRGVRASDGLEDEELTDNPEMKPNSGLEAEDNEFNTQNKLSSEKNVKDKKDSAVNAMGQVDSERQHQTCIKLNNEKTPVAKRLNKDKSSKGLKPRKTEQPSFREVAPVAETILTNPEIFDSSLAQEPQEQGCESLKGWEHGSESKQTVVSAQRVSEELSAEKVDNSNNDLKGISLLRPQTQSTQQSGDAVCTSDNIPESGKPNISSKRATESRMDEASLKKFEQKSTNYKGVDDENSSIARVTVEDCRGEDDVKILRGKVGSEDIDAQVNSEGPVMETAHDSKNNTVQRSKETRNALQLLPNQNSQAGTELDEANNNQEKVAGSVVQVAEQVAQIGQKVINQVSESLPDPVMEHMGQVAEHVSSVAEQVATTAGQVTDTVTSKFNDLLADDDGESEDEFEAYKTSDLPEFKGMAGLKNFTILQEDQGVMTLLHDFYTYMLKSSLPEFALAMFTAPILLSMIFTLLYLPEFQGLALEETARQFFQYAEESKEAGVTGLQLSWTTLFQVFMFSVSLSTGLQPELAPLSPYTLVVANLNALIGQLIFVFLSGAVFARLSQPSQPIRFSNVALVYPNMSKRRQRPEGRQKVLMARYVLAGPQPGELVDVKVDLAYKYNTVTRAGTFFRATQSLKLVRTEIAYLNYGMLVRHVIDETSPLYQRTPKMLKKEDAIFVLSVVGLERSSMQPVFHVQHYCVYDGDVVWDAEFEDMVLISQKNKLIIDHSKLSEWRSIQKMPGKD